MSKQFLFVLRRPPYGSIHVQEMLDIVMVAAAFDQKVSLVFLDDGVFQLKKGQKPQVSQLKNTAPIFQALALYDIHRLYVEEDSLNERGMGQNDLVLDVTIISRQAVAEMLKNGEAIFSA